MEVHTCSPNTWEAVARGSQVQGQPGYITRTYLKKKKKKISCIGAPV
jgi:hypothetical protein